MKCTLVIAVLAGLSPAAGAQVLPFNEAGVTMGHHHLMVPDVDAQTDIWVDVLGGEPSGNPPLQFIKFPGAFLIVSEGSGTDGTRGSALDHIAFDVRDLEGTREQLAAADVELFNQSDRGFGAVLPGGIEVHFFGVPGLATSIAHRAIVFASTDPDSQRTWWENVLGATTTQEGPAAVSTIPGARLLFSLADTAPAPTRGRTLDHTGIGVPDVGAFCERIAAKGVTCDMLFGGAAAMITDPAGVTVEINSGLENR